MTSHDLKGERAPLHHARVQACPCRHKLHLRKATDQTMTKAYQSRRLGSVDKTVAMAHPARRPWQAPCIGPGSLTRLLAACPAPEPNMRNPNCQVRKQANADQMKASGYKSLWMNICSIWSSTSRGPTYTNIIKHIVYPDLPHVKFGCSLSVVEILALSGGYI